jgi:hypothetical protein
MKLLGCFVITNLCGHEMISFNQSLIRFQEVLGDPETAAAQYLLMYFRARLQGC